MGAISLSHTSRTSFNTCKRKWYFQYVEGLRPKYKSQPLRMGTVFSDCLEAADPEVANERYNEMLLNIDGSSHSSFVDDLAWERAVVYELAKTYLEDNPPMLREIPFERQVGEGIEKGYIDGLIVHTDDTVTIIENKLKSRWTQADEKALATDAQVTQYVAAVMRMAGEHGIPEDITPDRISVRYDVTVKPGIRVKKGETPEAYQSRLLGDIQSRRSHYHRSFHTSRTQEQLDEQEVLIESDARHMAAEEKFFPTYHACNLYGLCEFHGICSAKDESDVMDAMARFDKKETE